VLQHSGSRGRYINCRIPTQHAQVKTKKTYPQEYSPSPSPPPPPPPHSSGLAASPVVGAAPSSSTSSSSHGMLMHVKKIRSEQQLSALLDYIQSAYIKIENLEGEKRRLKKQLRTWNMTFERDNGRAPTSKEGKVLMKDQYMDYEQVRCYQCSCPCLVSCIALVYFTYSTTRDEQHAAVQKVEHSLLFVDLTCLCLVYKYVYILNSEVFSLCMHAY
jgi:hypothetical protein